MSYQAKVIADSVAKHTGLRLTTLEVTFPRIVLSEFNTHRVFSRNSASSRAIPVSKQIDKVMDDPFVPIYWGKNQKGMSADQELTPEEQEVAIDYWLNARDQAVAHARDMSHYGVHKQLTNRLLEPFMWQTCIVSATEWSNFFALRANPQAQPEIRVIAEMMQKVYNESEPTELAWGAWHLPYIDDKDYTKIESMLHETSVVSYDLRAISAARCARVSYLTHDGVRSLDKDMELFDRLASSGHMSPLEHVATPANGWNGNFHGWLQFRKEFPNESDFGKVLL